MDVDGEMLKKIRKNAGWSQNLLAVKLGISRSYLAAIETGRRNVRCGISKRLKISLKEAGKLNDVRRKCVQDFSNHKLMLKYISEK